MSAADSEAFANLSVSALKEELRRHGVLDFSGMFEKKDLVERLVLERSRGAPPGVAHSSTATAGTGEELVFRLPLQQAKIIGNRKDPQLIIVVSHGLGDTGEGWADVAAHLAASHPQVLFVLPTAPRTAVTMNGGMKMNSWYDIISIGANAKEDAAGMRHSAAALRDLAQQACAQYGLDASRVVFAGFSQGAVISLWAAATAPTAVAGVVMLSGYLGARDALAPLLRDHAHGVPILMCHGESDPLIPLGMSHASHKAMVDSLGLTRITYKTYRGLQHSASPKEIADVSEWITGLLN